MHRYDPNGNLNKARMAADRLIIVHDIIYAAITIIVLLGLAYFFAAIYWRS